MKTKLLFYLFLGVSLTGCSVDPVEEVLENEVNAINSGIEDVGCAGPDNSGTILISEAVAIESWDEVRQLYFKLLHPGVSREGSFDPSIWNIIDSFNANEIKTGDYTTTYTINNGECSDSVKLTYTVIADSADPVCDLNAGEDNSGTIKLSEAIAIESWDQVRQLYFRLLQSGVPRNGTFDPSIWDIIDSFNANEVKLGDYTVTYTITDGECSDSVDLTYTVIPDAPSDPVCDYLNAGADNMRTITYSEVLAIESWDEVRQILFRLLEPGVPRNGSFDPSIWSLIDRFNETEDNLGDYTTTYTITDGECSDSVELTVRVIPD